MPLDPEVEQAQLETAEELIGAGGVEFPDTAYALTTSSGDQYIVLTSGDPQVAEVTVQGSAMSFAITWI